MPIATRTEIVATDEEIVAHLREQAAPRISGPFQPGQAVRIIDRAQVPENFGARNLAVVLWADAVAGTAMVIALHELGSNVYMSLPLTALAPLS